MDKCAVFVANYRGLDRYYINLIFAGRKISREENFAGGKFREIPFAVDFIFAGGKFRAKSKFANIAKISSTRKIGVIQYRSFLFLDEKHSAQKHIINPDGFTTLRMPVIPTLRLLFVIWTNAPFLLHYYRAIRTLFSRGGKFRAKSKFANIAKISSTRKIGVIQ